MTEQEANAAAAAKADDGRHTHVDVPAIEGEGNIRRHNLRNNGVHNHLQAIGAGGCYRFQGANGNIFHLLRVKFTQGDNGVQAQGHYPGKRANAYPHRKSHHHHQRLDGAEDVHNGANDVVDKHAGRNDAVRVGGNGQPGKKYRADYRRRNNHVTQFAKLIEPVQNNANSAKPDHAGQRRQNNCQNLYQAVAGAVFYHFCYAAGQRAKDEEANQKAQYRQAQ